MTNREIVVIDLYNFVQKKNIQLFYKDGLTLTEDAKRTIGKHIASTVLFSE